MSEGTELSFERTVLYGPRFIGNLHGAAECDSFRNLKQGVHIMVGCIVDLSPTQFDQVIDQMPYLKEGHCRSISLQDEAAGEVINGKSH